MWLFNYCIFNWYNFVFWLGWFYYKLYSTMRDKKGAHLFLPHKYNWRKPINKASFDDEHNHVLKETQHVHKYNSQTFKTK